MPKADKVTFEERPTNRVPPHIYFVVSAVFHYLGPAFAVLLFARIDVLGVAWLRIASAAVVFAAWRRPWRVWNALTRYEQRTVVAWGFVLAAMNCCFYIAIDRLPLSTVAAIEFIGPVVIAALGVRNPRNAVALLLAGAGIYTLTDIRFVSEPIGIAFAFANAALFTLYIVLGHRAAERGAVSGIDALGLSMLLAAAITTPLGVRNAGASILDPIVIAAGTGVGITSSVIPYVTDQLAFARLSRATYALFVSLLPATATILGIIVLKQFPIPHELTGIALVIGGVAVHQEPELAARGDQGLETGSAAHRSHSPRTRNPRD